MSPPAETVYVVDDEEPVRSSLGRLLRAIGFESVTYPSAEAFLAAYHSGDGGCLLLDLRMPGMSGLDLIEELTRRAIALPIIMMTGHTDDESKRRISQYDTLGFLEKPFSVEQLKEILERWRGL
jgi:two-component system response regulator FixJ